MPYINKEELDKMFGKMRKMLEITYLEGKIDILKIFRDSSIDSIDKGYTSINNCSRIKACNKTISDIEKEISKINSKKDSCYHGNQSKEENNEE